jgi:hypothetical protein
MEDLSAAHVEGQLAMELESYDWLAALLDYYGEEKGKAFAEKLGRQQPDFRRGSTLLSQLVAAGEVAIHLDGYNHTAYQLKQKKAPIEYIFPEPYVPRKRRRPSGSRRTRRTGTPRRCSPTSCYRAKARSSWPRRGAG